MTVADLVEIVARAYEGDRQPERAAEVRAGELEVVGPRTLRKLGGLLITWMACGCVDAHRRCRVGRRLLICGTDRHDPFADSLARDSGGSFVGAEAA